MDRLLVFTKIASILLLLLILLLTTLTTIVTLQVSAQGWSLPRAQISFAKDLLVDKAKHQLPTSLQSYEPLFTIALTDFIAHSQYHRTYGWKLAPNPLLTTTPSSTSVRVPNTENPATSSLVKLPLLLSPDLSAAHVNALLSPPTTTTITGTVGSGASINGGVIKLHGLTQTARVRVRFSPLSNLVPIVRVGAASYLTRCTDAQWVAPSSSGNISMSSSSSKHPSQQDWCDASSSHFVTCFDNPIGNAGYITISFEMFYKNLTSLVEASIAAGFSTFSNSSTPSADMMGAVQACLYEAKLHVEVIEPMAGESVVLARTVTRERVWNYTSATTTTITATATNSSLWYDMTPLTSISRSSNSSSSNISKKGPYLLNSTKATTPIASSDCAKLFSSTSNTASTTQSYFVCRTPWFAEETSSSTSFAAVIACIRFDQICDGRMDCLDGSDEAHCDLDNWVSLLYHTQGAASSPTSIPSVPSCVWWTDVSSSSSSPSASGPLGTSNIAFSDPTSSLEACQRWVIFSQPRSSDGNYSTKTDLVMRFAQGVSCQACYHLNTGTIDHTTPVTSFFSASAARFDEAVLVYMPPASELGFCVPQIDCHGDRNSLCGDPQTLQTTKPCCCNCDSSSVTAASWAPDCSTVFPSTFTSEQTPSMLMLDRALLAQSIALNTTFTQAMLASLLQTTTTTTTTFFVPPITLLSLAKKYGIVLSFHDILNTSSSLVAYPVSQQQFVSLHGRQRDRQRFASAVLAPLVSRRLPSSVVIFNDLMGHSAVTSAGFSEITCKHSFSSSIFTVRQNLVYPVSITVDVPVAVDGGSIHALGPNSGTVVAISVDGTHYQLAPVSTSYVNVSSGSSTVEVKRSFFVCPFQGALQDALTDALVVTFVTPTSVYQTPSKFSHFKIAAAFPPSLAVSENHPQHSEYSSTDAASSNQNTILFYSGIVCGFGIAAAICLALAVRAAVILRRDDVNWERKQARLKREGGRRASAVTTARLAHGQSTTQPHHDDDDEGEEEEVEEEEDARDRRRSRIRNRMRLLIFICVVLTLITVYTADRTIDVAIEFSADTDKWNILIAEYASSDDCRAVGSNKQTWTTAPRSFQLPTTLYSVTKLHMSRCSVLESAGARNSIGGVGRALVYARGFCDGNNVHVAMGSTLSECTYKGTWHTIPINSCMDAADFGEPFESYEMQSVASPISSQKTSDYQHGGLFFFSSINQTSITTVDEAQRQQQHATSYTGSAGLESRDFQEELVRLNAQRRGNLMAMCSKDPLGTVVAKAASQNFSSPQSVPFHMDTETIVPSSSSAAVASSLEYNVPTFQGVEITSSATSVYTVSSGTLTETNETAATTSVSSSTAFELWRFSQTSENDTSIDLPPEILTMSAKEDASFSLEAAATTAWGVNPSLLIQESSSSSNSSKSCCVGGLRLATSVSSTAASTRLENAFVLDEFRGADRPTFWQPAAVTTATAEQSLSSSSLSLVARTPGEVGGAFASQRAFFNVTVADFESSLTFANLTEPKLVAVAAAEDELSQSVKDFLFAIGRSNNNETFTALLQRHVPSPDGTNRLARTGTLHPIRMRVHDAGPWNLNLRNGFALRFLFMVSEHTRGFVFLLTENAECRRTANAYLKGCTDALVADAAMAAVEGSLRPNEAPAYYSSSSSSSSSSSQLPSRTIPRAFYGMYVNVKADSIKLVEFTSRYRPKPIVEWYGITAALLDRSGSGNTDEAARRRGRWSLVEVSGDTMTPSKIHLSIDGALRHASYRVRASSCNEPVISSWTSTRWDASTRSNSRVLFTDSHILFNNAGSGGGTSGGGALLLVGLINANIAKLQMRSVAASSSSNTQTSSQGADDGIFIPNTTTAVQQGGRSSLSTTELVFWLIGIGVVCLVSVICFIISLVDFRRDSGKAEQKKKSVIQGAAGVRSSVLFGTLVVQFVVTNQTTAMYGTLVEFPDAFKNIYDSIYNAIIFDIQFLSVDVFAIAIAVFACLIFTLVVILTATGENYKRTVQKFNSIKNLEIVEEMPCPTGAAPTPQYRITFRHVTTGDVYEFDPRTTTEEQLQFIAGFLHMGCLMLKKRAIMKGPDGEPPLIDIKNIHKELGKVVEVTKTFLPPEKMEKEIVVTHFGLCGRKTIELRGGEFSFVARVLESEGDALVDEEDEKKKETGGGGEKKEGEADEHPKEQQQNEQQEGIEEKKEEPSAAAAAAPTRRKSTIIPMGGDEEEKQKQKQQRVERTELSIRYTLGVDQFQVFIDDSGCSVCPVHKENVIVALKKYHVYVKTSSKQRRLRNKSQVEHYQCRSYQFIQFEFSKKKHANLVFFACPNESCDYAVCSKCSNFTPMAQLSAQLGSRRYVNSKTSTIYTVGVILFTVVESIHLVVTRYAYMIVTCDQQIKCAFDGCYEGGGTRGYIMAASVCWFALFYVSLGLIVFEVLITVMRKNTCLAESPFFQQAVPPQDQKKHNVFKGVTDPNLWPQLMEEDETLVKAIYEPYKFKFLIAIPTTKIFGILRVAAIVHGNNQIEDITVPMIVIMAIDATLMLVVTGLTFTDDPSLNLMGRVSAIFQVLAIALVLAYIQVQFWETGTATSASGNKNNNSNNMQQSESTFARYIAYTMLAVSFVFAIIFVYLLVFKVLLPALKQFFRPVELGADNEEDELKNIELEQRAREAAMVGHEVFSKPKERRELYAGPTDDKESQTIHSIVRQLAVASGDAGDIDDEFDDGTGEGPYGRARRGGGNGGEGGEENEQEDEEARQFGVGGKMLRRNYEEDVVELRDDTLGEEEDDEDAVLGATSNNFGGNAELAANLREFFPEEFREEEPEPEQQQAAEGMVDADALQRRIVEMQHGKEQVRDPRQENRIAPDSTEEDEDERRRRRDRDDDDDDDDEDDGAAALPGSVGDGGGDEDYDKSVSAAQRERERERERREQQEREEEEEREREAERIVAEKRRRRRERRMRYEGRKGKYDSTSSSGDKYSSEGDIQDELMHNIRGTTATATAAPEASSSDQQQQHHQQHQQQHRRRQNAAVGRGMRSEELDSRLNELDNALQNLGEF